MDIEKKALELVNAVERQRSLPQSTEIDRDYRVQEALCRAIEAHEAEREADNARHAAEMEAFKREVSEAVEAYNRGFLAFSDAFDRFIIPQPDPLVEAWNDAFGHGAGLLMVGQLKATLAARGLELVKKEPSQ